MRDYESNDIEGAAYLAAEDADDDRPTRAEAEAEFAELEDLYEVVAQGNVEVEVAERILDLEDDRPF